MSSKDSSSYFIQFVAIGMVAVIAGGTLSAFTAKQPTTFAMWASAYLVLVMGVVQAGFGVMLARMVREVSRKLLYAALVLFNVGSLGVIASSAMKYGLLPGNRVLVISIGSALLLAGLAIFGYLARSAEQSKVKLLFYITLVGIAICVPIGILLAQR